MAHIWEGVLPAVTTKFHADFSIDREWTGKNIEAQIDAGVDGIIVCGSLGEASTLSLDEKLQASVVRPVSWCCPGCATCRTGAKRCTTFAASPMQARCR